MKIRDLCVSLITFAYLFIGYGFILVENKHVNEPTIIEEIVEEVIVEQEGRLSNYHIAYLWHTKMNVMLALTHVSYTKEIQNLEEYNCLFYATVPIGRYYITAYNHEETGSKITASGKTCHEGTISTCAADPKYHKFGTYLEIDGRLYVVEDTGSAVKRRHIDLYFSDYKTMSRYGSNYQNIYKVEFPFGKPEYA